MARLRFSVLGIGAGEVDVTSEQRGVPLEEAMRSLRGGDCLRAALGKPSALILDVAGTARRLDRGTTLGAVSDVVEQLGCVEAGVDLSIEARGGARP
jgi:hypothetical protein